MDEIETLERAIAYHSSNDDEGPDDLSIEKMGSSAFDWLRKELRNSMRTSSQRVRAVLLMARLSRQFCVDRKGDLLDDAIDLITEDGASLDLRFSGNENCNRECLRCVALARCYHLLWWPRCSAGATPRNQGGE